MSGVMLKTAVYGMLRVTFDLLGTPRLVVGPGRRSASGCSPRFYGVVFAAVQTDMKRLLAYSSIENIGHPVHRLRPRDRVSRRRHAARWRRWR